MKYVFITGVSTGIGYDASKRLLENGYHVIGTVRTIKDLERLEREFIENFSGIICDITIDQQLEDAVKKTALILGQSKLYCLINNAGIAIPGPLHLMSDSDFHQQLNVNLMATRKVTNRLIPYLAGNQQTLTPRIIFISSISGIFAAPFNGAYCISKHAVECMVDIYRRELHFLDIKVVALQPGPIKTKIWDKAIGLFDQYKGGKFDALIEKADKIITKTEKHALDVSLISDRILKILEDKNPSHRYMIHKNKTMFKLVAHYMPTSWLDKLIWKNLGQKDPKKYRPV